jgi:hypothetical protein
MVSRCVVCGVSRSNSKLCRVSHLECTKKICKRFVVENKSRLGHSKTGLRRALDSNVNLKTLIPVASHGCTVL